MADKKRLIDAAALRVQFDDIPPFIGMTGGCVQQFIDKAPTVDAMEVVRCKDCKKWDEKIGYCEEFTTKRFPHGGQVAFITHENDFCSYGERRTDGA